MEVRTYEDDQVKIRYFSIPKSELGRIERYMPQFTKKDVGNYFEVTHQITESDLNNNKIASMLYGRLEELDGDHAILSPAIWAEVYPTDFFPINSSRKVTPFKFVESSKDIVKRLKRGGRAKILQSSIRDIVRLDHIGFPIQWGLRDKKLP